METLNLEDLLAEIASEEATNFGLPILDLDDSTRAMMMLLYISWN